MDTDATNNTAMLQRRELDLRWYQARLGFWQAIWGTLITGGLAVAIPSAVNSFKIYQERLLKEQQIALQDKETDEKYISQFLKTALDPDIQTRIRFSQYFSFVSSDKSNRQGWGQFNDALTKRRETIRIEINQKETEKQKLRAKQGSLSIDDQSKLDQLSRELDWDYAELGAVTKVLQAQ